MSPKEILRHSLDLSDFFVKSYLNDLDGEDLLLQPTPGFNPIALQLGHLISVERRLMERTKPGASPPLPEGFDERHSLKEGAKDDRSRYLTKDQYLALWDAQRAATKSILDGLTDEELEAPGPEGFKRAPNVAAVVNLLGLHAASHAGQWVAVRRQLGKPVAF